MAKKFCKKCNKVILARDGVYCKKCALEEYEKTKRTVDRTHTSDGNLGQSPLRK